MRFLETILHKQKPNFEKGGKLEKFYYLYEAGETFMFTPATVTKNKGAQIRDAIDLKRMMMTVVIAMIPPMLFGIYNIGYQHFLAQGLAETTSWFDMVLVGIISALPVIIVAYAAGGLVEVVFALWRKHPINEGFLVTGLLIPLIMPPTIPLWQVAVATIFAVVIAKEIFGGTGMNFLNIAMTARAFLYFAYPTDISGDVWVYLDDATKLADGYTGATFLALGASAYSTGEPLFGAAGKIAEATAGFAPGLFTLENLFWGLIPGSIGETSTLMCLIGAAIIIFSGVGSWKIIFSVFGGAWLMGLVFNAFGGNAYAQMPAHYHLVAGGLAFGAVYMATDPVSAAHTEVGKWIYGFLIGAFTVLLRVVNPAYPEGIMLAVLLMNVVAPLIDFYVVNANKNRRLKRATV